MLTFLSLLFSVLWICSSAIATKPLHSLNLDAAPTQVVLNDRLVHFTTANTIMILNEDLSIVSRMQLDEVENNAVITSLVPEGDQSIVACFSDGSCSFTSLSNQSNAVNQVQIYKSSLHTVNSMYSAAVVGVDRVVYVGAEGVSSNKLKTAELAMITSSHPNSFQHPEFSLEVVQALHITAAKFLMRTFEYAFYHKNYIYFLAKDSFVNPHHESIKIIRTSQSNGSGSYQLDINYEIELQQSNLGNDYYLENIVSAKLGNTLVVGLVGQDFCDFYSYSLTDVDQAIDTTRKLCSHGSYEFLLPWSQQFVTCKNLKEMVSVTRTVISKDVVQGANHLHVASGATITATAISPASPTHFSVYIATSGTKHQMKQYLVPINSMESRLVDTVEFSDAILHINPSEKHLYVTTKQQILAFDVDYCQHHKSCDECMSTKDMQCGWCVADGRCSAHAHCKSSPTSSHWLQGSKLKCLDTSGMESSAHEQRLSVDDLHPVQLLSGLQHEYLPGNYTILCVAKPSPFTTKGFVHSNSIYCNFTSISRSAVFNQQREVQVKYSVHIKSDDEEITLTRVEIAFFNCSAHFNCSDCVAVRGCGWCGYEGVCAAATFLCGSANVAQGKQLRASSSCPMLLPSPSGRYVFPVGVSVNISLVTKNLVPPIPGGCEYICKLHSAGGVVSPVPAIFNTSTQVLCKITPGKVVVPLKKGEEQGVEHLGVTLWMRNEGREIQIEHHQQQTSSGRLKRSPDIHMSAMPSVLSRFMRASAVDCTQFSDSCSLCMAANMGAVSSCVWCLSGGQPFCSALSQCSSTFINSSIRCPGQPIIRSIVPRSGPSVGGTVLTITGVDLGVLPQDLDVRLGDANCSIDYFSYLPARQLSCVSGPSSLMGPVRINITVRRIRVLTAMFANGVSDKFTYARPVLTSVWPTYGPLSGGTLLHLTGSALNISNTALVTVVEKPCAIHNISFHEIFCVTAAAEEATSGSIKLRIDHASLLGDYPYSYMENPQFDLLEPQYTIPSGGVRLVFHGNNLNVSVQPTMVVYVDDIAYSSICKVATSHLLYCRAPKLVSLVTQDPSKFLLVEEEGVVTPTLNYTIVMGRAPGPDIHNQSLSLTLRNDPIQYQLASNSTVYQVFSGKAISITGLHLDSVQKNEISVTLLDESCSITAITSTVLQCVPPDFPIRNDRAIEVKVSIGGGALVFNVGSLLYVLSTSGSTSSSTVAVEEPFSQIWIVVIALSFVGVCIIILLIGLILTICSIAARRRNRIFRVTQQNELPDPRIDSCLEKSTNSVNWYEVVSDPMSRNGSTLALNSERNFFNQILQPSHSAATSRILQMASERDGRSSQILMTASPNNHSVPSLYNESRGCSVGRQSYNGLLLGDHAHNNEEYVRMSSRIVSSNLSIATAAHSERHHNVEREEDEDEEEEEVEEEERVGHHGDRFSVAEYVDMQAPELGSKYGVPPDSPPIKFHQNLETVV